jgi:hypothetical protein
VKPIDCKWHNCYVSRLNALKYFNLNYAKVSQMLLWKVQFMDGTTLLVKFIGAETLREKVLFVVFEGNCL